MAADPLPLTLSHLTTGTVLIGTLVLIFNITWLTARQESEMAALAVERAALEVERRSQHEELVHTANHDPLTQTLNRYGLYQKLERSLRSSGPRALTAVIYVDLDYFKPVNDRHGHAAGDHLLQLTAQRLAGLLRADDSVARIGGDEFILVLERVDDPQLPDDVAARVDSALRQPFHLGDVVVRISGSIGSAVAADGSVTADELLQRADAAMYTAKKMRK
ncbi:GGDEF domain-containing protein [Kineococcus sp. NBC_00420]|uniref:GGDEF domain-containing protein n=1 Tax=Kineococcus sp. NBC_00420 TaxID=2903564 RepID=UPI002E1FAFAC